MKRREETILLTFALLAASIQLVSARKDIMKDIILGYGEALEVCRLQAGVSPELLEEFYHAWDKEYVVVHREIGCALHCMSDHHDLLHDDQKLNHGSIDEYVKRFNGGHVLNDLIVDMTTKCEEKYIDMVDDCDRTVQIFNCFKDRAFVEGIAPQFDKKN